MPPNSFSDLFTYITQLMTEDAAIFERLGTQLYGAFTLILVVWFGIEWAFGGGLRMEKLVNMVLMISFGLAMTQYYSRPIPGFGVSFYHLIVDQGTVLANRLNGAMASQVLERLDLMYQGLATPGVSAILNVLEVVRWVIIVSALILAEVSVFLVISFGYVAVAVCVLLGPIFIPFIIVPKMEWMFWGWLRAMLQYAFYPVVANAYVFVFGKMLINFTDQAGTEYSGPRIAALFVPLVFMLVAFTWGILKVPSLVNSLFAGKAGESVLPTW